MCQEVHSRTWTWMINRLMWQEPLQRCHSPISGHAMLAVGSGHQLYIVPPLSCAPQRVMHALCYGEITALLINWCIHTNTLQETCSHTQNHTSPIYTHYTHHTLTTCSHTQNHTSPIHTHTHTHHVLTRTERGRHTTHCQLQPHAAITATSNLYNTIDRGH